jgi:hypothetical protein
MTRMRHIVAVMVVAGALGADRLAVAAPIRAPQLSQTVRQLADRFTGSFRSELMDVRPQRPGGELRVAGEPSAGSAPVISPLAVLAHHDAQSTPYQFRLPPPSQF